MEDQLEMRELHQAIQERIVTGICNHQGGCSEAGIPALDLRGLEPTLPGLDAFRVQALMDKVKAYTGILCLLVITKE